MFMNIIIVRAQALYLFTFRIGFIFLFIEKHFDITDSYI